MSLAAALTLIGVAFGIGFVVGGTIFATAEPDPNVSRMDLPE